MRLGLKDDTKHSAENSKVDGQIIISLEDISREIYVLLRDGADKLCREGEEKQLQLSKEGNQLAREGKEVIDGLLQAIKALSDALREHVKAMGKAVPVGADDE